MAEQILEIKQDVLFTLDKDYPYDYEGFIIKTTEQEIKVGIDNFQCCCEDWGYFITNDDIKEFIGATLLEVTVVDTCLKTEKIPECEVPECVMYINLETSAGKLQFTVYNDHNGYYGHDAVLISKQKCEERTL